MLTCRFLQQEQCISSFGEQRFQHSRNNEEYMTRSLPAFFSAIFLTALLLCSPSINAYAQEGYEHLSPLAHGTGRSYSLTSQGLDAVGLNPALLGLEQDKHFQISIFPISAFGIDAGPSFRDVSALSNVFNSNQTFSADSARNAFLNLVSNHKLSGRGDARIFGLYYYMPSIGGLALTWTSHAGIRADVPQEFIDFFGSDQAISNILTKELSTTSPFDIQGIWYNEFGGSFGKTLIHDSTGFLHDFSIGGAIKYVVGIGYMGIDPDNYLRLIPRNSATEFVANYKMRFAYPDEFDPTKIPNRFSFDILSSQSAGSGIGFDLGTTIGLIALANNQPALRLSVSACDIGSIKWDKNTQIRHADSVDFYVATQAAKLQDIVDSLSRLAGKLENVSSFTTPLPSVLRIGASLDLAGIGINPLGTNFIGTVEYSTGLTDVVGSPKNDRIGVGFLIDRPSPTIGLRGGIGYALNNNGKGDVTLALGTTILDHVVVDIATAQLSSLLGNSDGNTDLALGLRVQF